jgi:(5-formylfuran-3-yl)methyl phosphate synthase
VVLPTLAAAGFAGAMLDTMDKSAGSLTKCCAVPMLGDFVRQGRDRGLLTGLAGSLGEADIEPLLELEPDYLGFRGALCLNAQRRSPLDPCRVGSVLKCLRSANATV